MINIIKLFDAFAGIGALYKAMKNINLDVELIGFSEIDKNAIKSYCAIHGVDENLNFGDITKINPKELPNFDFMNCSFPCQDISISGKKKGFIDENGKITRSGLYYYGFNIVKEKRPKYVLVENVKNLLGKKFMPYFKEILNDFNYIGYNTYWKVLNAKDFGIPQHRERVFILCIRKDIDDNKFSFPNPIQSNLKVKDFLEDEVDEKYYISDEKKNIIFFERGRDYTNILKDDENIAIPVSTPNRIKRRCEGRRFKTDGEPMFTLTTQDRHGVLIYNKLKQVGYINTNFQGNRIYDVNGISSTITSNGEGIGSKTNLYLLDNYKIRKLTPLECWRLMGFKDEDFYKAKNLGLSDNQLYKLAGNSIVVNVLEEILKKIFSKKIE